MTIEEKHRRIHKMMEYLDVKIIKVKMTGRSNREMTYYKDMNKAVLDRADHQLVLDVKSDEVLNALYDKLAYDVAENIFEEIHDKFAQERLGFVP